MKRKYLLVWLVTAGLVLAACSGKPSHEEAAPAANAPSAGEVVEAAPPADTGCFASIPLLAGSREDAGRQADTGATILSMGGKTDWFPGEIRVYSTSRSTDAVLEHFKAALPEAGWEESSNIPGKNWGFVRWQKEGLEAQLLTGQFDQTVYVLGCLQLAPTPTPIPVAALAMKASFDLLEKVSGLNDLAFYNYQAFGVKEDGLAVKYTISGYSASAGKFCYLQADEQVVELNCRDESCPLRSAG